MKRRTIFAWPLIAAASSSTPADPRMERLFTTFIAPCCWRANLLVHQSPKAEELRTDLRRMVAAGKSDEEIKAAYVKQYSMRILAMPEGARGQWLSWAPVLAVASGIGAVTLAIQRMRQIGSPAAPTSLPPLSELE